jgi:DNA-binding NarL/FixJ family response regulator
LVFDLVSPVLQKLGLAAALDDLCEREVLQLIAEGFSTKEIASKLNLSEKTVAAHREHIMAKLEMHSVVELTRYALRDGISEL